MKMERMICPVGGHGCQSGAGHGCKKDDDFVSCHGKSKKDCATKVKCDKSGKKECASKKSCDKEVVAEK